MQETPVLALNSRNHVPCLGNRFPEDAMERSRGESLLAAKVIHRAMRDCDDLFFYSADSDIDVWCSRAWTTPRDRRREAVNDGYICTPEQYRLASARKDGWRLRTVRHDGIRVCTFASHRKLRPLPLKVPALVRSLVDLS